MFILVNGTDKNEKTLINTEYVQAVEESAGDNYLHLKDDVIRIGDSAQKVAAMIENAERPKKETISLIDVIDRAIFGGHVNITFKGYGVGYGAIEVQDAETGQKLGRRYKCGSEEAAALCIIDALEERKK